MHIGFDVSQTGADKAGCGFFAYAMAQALLQLAPEHQYSFLPSFGDFYFDSQMSVGNPYPKGNMDFGPRHSTLQIARNFWSSSDVQSHLGDPDIVHSNNFWCPIQLSSSRLFYTLYDLGFTVNTEWTTETNRVGCFEGVFRASIAADWIVAISKASRDHFLSIFPHFPKDRIRVIYPCSRFTDLYAEGIRPSALADIPSEGFWLNVGTMEPRKNQRLLIDAYYRYLALGGSPMPLVFAGGKGWLMDEFQKQLDESGINQKIIVTGYVSDDELIWLYRNCYANLYPSLFEGFGLPVLEGMQFGAPTFASCTSSIPEVAGDAAILLDPEDIEEWANAMLRLSNQNNERNHLRDSAKIQAKQFDWITSATDLLQLYQEAIVLPKKSLLT